MGAAASSANARKMEAKVREKCNKLESDVWFMLGDHAQIVSRLIEEPNPTDFGDEVGYETNMPS